LGGGQFLDMHQEPVKLRGQQRVQSAATQRERT
jgi:hypothetical protein